MILSILMVSELAFDAGDLGPALKLETDVRFILIAAGVTGFWGLILLATVDNRDVLDGTAGCAEIEARFPAVLEVDDATEGATDGLLVELVGAAVLVLALAAAVPVTLPFAGTLGGPIVDLAVGFGVAAFASSNTSIAEPLFRKIPC